MRNQTEPILVAETQLVSMSNSNGVFAYFVDEKYANDFSKFINTLEVKLEGLKHHVSKESETGLNEIDFILNELNKLKP